MSFLTVCQQKRESLASVGVIIEEKDYRSTILTSIPPYLAKHASTLLTAAKLFSSNKEVDPENLIHAISEEYDRLEHERAKRSRQSGKGKDSEQDEAMSVSSSSGGNKKGKKPGKKLCWGCGKEGHFKNKCPDKKSSDNDGKASGSKGEIANVAEESSDSDWEAGGAFGVDDASDMPSLAAVSESDESEVEGLSEDLGDEDDGADLFSEVGDESWDELSSALSSDVDWSDVNSFVDRESDATSGMPTLEEVSASDESVAAVINAANSPDDRVRTELYDSGCTRHISPYREDFNSFQSVPPKAFRAANTQKFSAAGKGEMCIDVLNGANASNLQLTEVMYSPEVGYTLISVGRLDDLGFELTFGGGKCIIRAPDGEVVGVVPKDDGGLYRVRHEGDSAGAAEEVLTLDQLHRRMGHISPEVARRLVEKGFVTGIKLDKSSGEPQFCESCIYAKATRKPVSKARRGRTRN